MIKAIIFDFFGVIVTEGLKQFLDTYFPNDPEKRRSAIDIVVRIDSGEANLTTDSLTQELSKMAGVQPSVVERFLGNNQPNRVLLDYIRKELKPKYKVGILSNAGADFVSDILPQKDQELFDDKVLSYRFAMAKPAQEIYKIAAGRLGAETNECVFVDDSKNHCEGTRATGMYAIFYEDFPSMRTRLERILPASSNN